MNFSLLQNVRIVEGPGCVAKVGEILKEAGYSKAFLVFDCGVKAAGIVDKVVAALDSAGVAHVLFDRVLPDPPRILLMKGPSIVAGKAATALSAWGEAAALIRQKALICCVSMMAIF